MRAWLENELWFQLVAGRCAEGRSLGVTPCMSEIEFARACLAGDTSELSRLDGLVRSVCRNDEVHQAVMQKLLVDRRLEQFDGRSSLGRWLRTVAARLQVDLVRASREDAVEARVLESLLPPGNHLEAQIVGLEARTALQAALREALLTLTKRDQLFVQHAYLDGLTLTAIGQLYQVAPSTVMRAIDRSLAVLRTAAKTHLAQVMKLGARSVESLVRTGLDA